MAWRVARSLDVLRDQFDRRYPDRDRISDGSIGDADHATRDSDHNPWYGPGIVTARDFTHDPDCGMDIDRITDELAASRDPRIKYVISNGLIMSGREGPSPWTWRPYRGPNPHRRHFHLSVVASPLCDDVRGWNLPSLENAMACTDEHIRNFHGQSVPLGVVVSATEGRMAALQTEVTAIRSELRSFATREQGYAENLEKAILALNAKLDAIPT